MGPLSALVSEERTPWAISSTGGRATWKRVTYAIFRVTNKLGLLLCGYLAKVGRLFLRKHGMA